jgi:hypothetical protein
MPPLRYPSRGHLHHATPTLQLMPFMVISGDGEARRQGAWDDVKLPLMVNCSAPRPIKCAPDELFPIRKGLGDTELGAS